MLSTFASPIITSPISSLLQGLTQWQPMNWWMSYSQFLCCDHRSNWNQIILIFSFESQRLWLAPSIVCMPLIQVYLRCRSSAGGWWGSQIHIHFISFRLFCLRHTCYHSSASFPSSTGGLCSCSENSSVSLFIDEQEHSFSHLSFWSRTIFSSATKLYLSHLASKLL